MIHTIRYEYDEAQMLAAEDVTLGVRYEYGYDDLGRVDQIDLEQPGPDVSLGFGYDANGGRTSITAEIDGVDDFQNAYSYDPLGRLVRLDQQGQSGGNGVAEKRFDFAYEAAGQSAAITRYRDLGPAALCRPNRGGGRGGWADRDPCGGRDRRRAPSGNPGRAVHRPA